MRLQPFVLREGHGLISIGINQDVLRKKTWKPIYVQLADLDEDFAIQVKEVTNNN